MNATAPLYPTADHTAFAQSVRYHLQYSLARSSTNASLQDYYTAVALTTRDYAIDALNRCQERFDAAAGKQVYYLSMEFLVGRLLGNNLQNLGIYSVCQEALEALGVDLADVLEQEIDPALGNGGLGRLAACFLDSIATLGIPGYGYGINYEFGLFRQSFVNGYQRERPDHWTTTGMPWLIERGDQKCVVPVYGRVENLTGPNDEFNPSWVDWSTLIGVPFDLPVVGYGADTVNYLRLYSARASDDFDIRIFNQGDYIRAVEQKISTETVSKVLYPSDAVEAGKELRLIQEYFFAACCLRDIINKHASDGQPIETLSQRVAVQLNDTHPALAIAEFMRLLVDEEGHSWEASWDATVGVMAYTNHTLLAEALEKWPVDLLERVVPRHLQIVYEINRRFLEEVRLRFPGDEDRVRRMSIIEEEPVRQIRMAQLSIVGSHSINGVAEMHSELVRTDLVPDFFELYPDRFNNKTNGVTQRRWMLSSNPSLSSLITEAIGDRWITDLDRLRELEQYADDSGFLERLAQIKMGNKERLAQAVFGATRTEIPPHSVFDVQIKRIHEYKRQLLNALHIVHLYLHVVEDRAELPQPHTFIFGGKAAPGYATAKTIIKLINNLARVVNSDPRARDQLRVVFYPDYKVSVAERIIPAADLSEQISTAGYEASGTGNMKLALNGALTIGTMDGANVEIHEEVGDDNIYIFGLSSDDVKRVRAEGYNPQAIYENNDNVRRVINALLDDSFCRDEPGIFRPIVDLLTSAGDYYMHLADFDDYVRAHEAARSDFTDRTGWSRRALLNIARCGKFSSDRTIRQYANDIWGLNV